MPNPGVGVFINFNLEVVGWHFLGRREVDRAAHRSRSFVAEGEVRISSGGGAEILLRNNGDVILRGNIFLEGTVIINGAPYISGIGALGG